MGKRGEQKYKICLTNKDNQQSKASANFFYSIIFTSWLSVMNAIATAGIPLWLACMGVSACNLVVGPGISVVTCL